MSCRLIFTFVLGAIDCRATDEIPPYDLPGYNSAFSPIVVAATVVALDEASPGKPAILKGHPARWDAISQDVIFTVNRIPTDGSFSYSPRYLQPPLQIGEHGYWTVMCLAGRARVLYEPAFGRFWPVIDGRDEEYSEVKAWAELMTDSWERQADIEGKQWPAPPAKPKPASAQPPSFFERLLPAEPAPRPAMPPSGSVEPRGFKAAWPWLTGMLVSLVLGLLIGAGLARKREV